MISKEEIERIKFEEQIRAEVRNSLNPPQKKNFWYFLNSSFGLWFLSTVAVGLITYGYSQLNKEIEKNTKNRNKIDRLDLEIEGRIYQLQTIKKRQIDSTSITDPSFNSQFKALWIEFKRPPIKSNFGFYSVYEEFNNRNIVSLIIDLSSLIENQKEKEKLRNCFKNPLATFKHY